MQVLAPLGDSADDINSLSGMAEKIPDSVCWTFLNSMSICIGNVELEQTIEEKSKIVCTDLIFGVHLTYLQITNFWIQQIVIFDNIYVGFFMKISGVVPCKQIVKECPFISSFTTYMHAVLISEFATHF